MSILRGRIALAAAVAALAAIAALAVALYAGSAAEHRPMGAAATAGTAAESEAASSTSASEAETGAPVVDTPALPAIAATEVRGVGPKDVQIDESILALSANGKDLFVTPTRESRAACLSLMSTDGATVSCTPLSAVAEGTAPPASAHEGCRLESRKPMRLTCATTVYYGLVPDGIDRVAVNVRSGDAPTADVANGAYLVEVKSAQGPESISFANDDRVKFSQPAPTSFGQ